jgi:hypothetical protein
MPGYREEPGADPRSRTQTYAAPRLGEDNWRWAGVPFYMRTGKRLPKRVTEVVLQFQRRPHLPISAGQARGLEPDALILHIQPGEGITLRFGVKVPGHLLLVRPASMEFSDEAMFRQEFPEAYERLMLDALIGDPTLFICSRRGRAVLAHRRPEHRALGRQPRPHPVLRGRLLGPYPGRPAARPRWPQLAQHVTESFWWGGCHPGAYGYPVSSYSRRQVTTARAKRLRSDNAGFTRAVWTIAKPNGQRDRRHAEAEGFLL